MVKYKNWIFAFLIIIFLVFSFYPTIFELQHKDNLADKSREFVLEHNYYWPDYNLYLSKIRQGLEGRLTALERYTSEVHSGSLIQEFYVTLGWLGRVFQLDPNYTYLLGRLILSPLLLVVILLLVKVYFKSFIWQIIAFLVVVSSGSFPRVVSENGSFQIYRYMEWWSNIDALQRITFIPHILFGQVVSFFILYQLTLKQISPIRLIILILLGNAAGLTFPPSLITLDAVLLLIFLIKTFKRKFCGEAMLFEHSHSPHHNSLLRLNLKPNHHNNPFTRSNLVLRILRRICENFRRSHTGRLNQDDPNPNAIMLKILQNNNSDLEFSYLASKKIFTESLNKAIFIIFTAPSLLYIFLITKTLPWSALVNFHRTHPMMIPFDQYILGTGPVFFLGFAGAILSIIKKEKKWQPLIFWVLATFSFAAIFSVIRDQSPLRFTQTGLFIPLGLLGAYLFYELYHLSNLSHLSDLSRSQAKAALIIILSLYLLGSLYMMKTSLDWQTRWLTQKIGANIPPVPYPPQSVYPLKGWMEGIRWLKNNTKSSDVVLAEITAGNYIPTYSGNTVYFGQSNTVDYNRKEIEVDKFFRGKMKENEASLFLANGRIKYIFFSVQEKEKTPGRNFSDLYRFVKVVYSNPLVTIYATVYN